MPAVRRSRARVYEDGDYAPIKAACKRSSSASSSAPLAPILVKLEPQELMLAMDMADDGFPTQAQYTTQVEAMYYKNMHHSKHAKALIDQATYDKIMVHLTDPDSKADTAQFRFWVRKMFTLGTGPVGTPIAIHEGQAIAVKEHIYSLLVECHGLARHGGRDKTNAIVRDCYTWVPKELVALFVKACPTCNLKRSRNATLRDIGLKHAHTARRPFKRSTSTESSLMPSTPYVADSPPFAWTFETDTPTLGWVNPQYMDVCAPSKPLVPEHLSPDQFFARPRSASSISSDSSSGSSFSSCSSEASSPPSFGSPMLFPAPPPLQRAASAPAGDGLPGPCLPIGAPLSAPPLAYDGEEDYFALAPNPSPLPLFPWQEGYDPDFKIPLANLDLSAPVPHDLIMGLKSLALSRCDSDIVDTTGDIDAATDISIDPELLSMAAMARGTPSTSARSPCHDVEEASPLAAEER